MEYIKGLETAKDIISGRLDYEVDSTIRAVLVDITLELIRKIDLEYDKFEEVMLNEQR